jgi:hypothetical protein
MDVYTIFKFLHVMAALAWVGGGMTLLVSSILAVRDHGELAAIRAGGTTAALGKRWFMPASLLTLVFGAVTTTLGGFWGELWVIVGLAGAATTFLTGLLFVERLGRRMGALMAEGRESEAVATGRTLLRVGKFDYTVMFLIVADMVLKPDWSDYATLTTMALVLAAGAFAFLVLPAREPAPSPA